MTWCCKHIVNLPKFKLKSEVAKVTLKALSDESLLKSNGDKVLNDDFPYKLMAMKCLTLDKNL
jgi:hypothetical protein